MSRAAFRNFDISRSFGDTNVFLLHSFKLSIVKSVWEIFAMTDGGMIVMH